MSLGGLLKKLIRAPKITKKIRLSPPRLQRGVEFNCTAIAIASMANAMQWGLTPASLLGGGNRISSAVLGTGVSYLREPSSAKRNTSPEERDCQTTEQNTTNTTNTNNTYTYTNTSSTNNSNINASSRHPKDIEGTSKGRPRVQGKSKGRPRDVQRICRGVQGTSQGRPRNAQGTSKGHPKGA